MNQYVLASYAAFCVSKLFEIGLLDVHTAYLRQCVHGRRIGMRLVVDDFGVRWFVHRPRCRDDVLDHVE